jgi:ABC-type glutathione transport system ATPase component
MNYCKRAAAADVESGSQCTTRCCLQMDLLAGRLQRVAEMTIQGEVLVNDKPMDYRRFRKSSGYVTQHDYLPPTETVRECLMFSAQLRLPAQLSMQERRDRVDRIIEDLVRASSSFSSSNCCCHVPNSTSLILCVTANDIKGKQRRRLCVAGAG